MSEKKKFYPNKQLSIAILGSGVIGQTIGRELQNRGVRDITIYTDRKLNKTTSVKAGAVFEPYRPGKMSNQKMTEYVEVGLEEYQKIIEKNSEDETGIRLHDLYSTSTGKIDLDNYPFLSAIPDWDLIEGNEVPGYYESAVVLRSVPFIDPRIALLWLAREFEATQESLIKVVPTVISLQDFIDEVPADIIINATGFGSKDLLNDPQVKPMRGQIAVMDYQPESKDSILGDDGYYIFPRTSGELILGGTTEEGVNSEDTEPETIARIIANAQKFLPDLTFQNLLFAYAGVRPYRTDGLRVAKEERFNTDKTVISAYGHGGSGWTFNFGTAKDVADIVEESQLAESKEKFRIEN